MKSCKKIVASIIGFTLASPFAAMAAMEREPNNFEENATLVSAGQVEAAVNDEKDWFKVQLPATGPVTVVLSGIPVDLKVQLGVKGFPHVGWEDGKGDIRYSFNATNSEGLIWVQFQWASSVCGSDWCAAQYSPGGPWHATKPSAGMPGSYEGLPILRDIPSYRLFIETAATPMSSSSGATTGGQSGGVIWDDEAESAPPGQIIWEDDEPFGNEPFQNNFGSGEGG